MVIGESRSSGRLSHAIHRVARLQPKEKTMFFAKKHDFCTLFDKEAENQPFKQNNYEQKT